MKIKFKIQALFAIVTLTATLTAEPFAQVKPLLPWVKSGENSFTLRYDGKNWPALQITAPLASHTFYRIDFQAQTDVKEKLMSLKVKGKQETSYKWRCSNAWANYRMYVYTGESDNLGLNIQPEADLAAKIELRNLTVTPMTEQELQGNLLPDGDFEDGNPTASHWLAAYKTEAFPGEIVANVDYLAGEKNLQITFAKQEKNLPGLESIFLPMRPGKHYQLSFWARSTGDDATFSAVIDTFSLHHSGSHFYQQKKFTAKRQWQKFTVDAAIPTDMAKYPDLLENTGRIRFNAVSHELQTIQLDDICFAEQSTTP